MANTFNREPLDGGDQGSWGGKELTQNRIAIGINMVNLYDDSAALKVAIGKIGMDNGSTKGVVIVDTITTVSLVGVSNGNWAKIEVTVSGTIPTFTAADITGATSAAVLPTEFTDSYDPDKGGFYISSNKRVVALAWKTSGGVLGGIINVGSVTNDYDVSWKIIEKSATYIITELEKKLIISITRTGSAQVYTLPDPDILHGKELILDVRGVGVGNVSLVGGTGNINGIAFTSWIWHGEGTLHLTSLGTSYLATSGVWDTGVASGNKWRKHTDKNMHQTIRYSAAAAITTVGVNLFRNADGAIVPTFPVAFIAAPVVIPCLITGIVSIICLSSNTTGYSVRVWSETSTSGTITHDSEANGDWV